MFPATVGLEESSPNLSCSKILLLPKDGGNVCLPLLRRVTVLCVVLDFESVQGEQR